MDIGQGKKLNKVDFQVTANDLHPVIRVLREALIQKPELERMPYIDLKTALESCSDFLKAFVN